MKDDMDALRGRIVKRYKKIQFAGDYNGLEAEIWANPPMKILDQMQSGITRRIYEAICSLVKSWNFSDDKGKQIPVSPDGIRDEVPAELILKIIESVTAEITSPKATKPLP